MTDIFDMLDPVILTIKTKDGHYKAIAGHVSTCQRIAECEVPAGMFKYGIRHTDNDDTVPSTLEKKVVVNHYGDFITNQEIEIPESGYIDIIDWEY